MNLPELCIRRPVMTTLLTAALCIYGAMAYKKLPVSDLPNVDFPTIVVTASLPGATPETMASAVATLLENQFSTISGIDSMSSISLLGSSRITLQFALNRDIDAAAQDVQTAIAAVQRRLPKDMTSPPSFRKTNPADQPVLYLTMGSPTLPLPVVHEYAETILAQQISMVEGVSQVQVYGAQKRAVRVRLDLRLLASRGISLDEVKNALSEHNVNLPTGVIDGARQSVTILASGQLNEVMEFKDIVVAYRNGAPVKLGELAEVIDSVQNNRVASWYYKEGLGTRAIVLAVERQPGMNTVEVVNRVKAILPAFMEQLPESINLSILRDRSEAVNESVHDVQFTMVLSVCLVILVIFLFLRNLSATFIPSVAIPMALLGTFVVMYFCGYTLDNFSLLALTLAVGFVVDDAIVMLENIVRHIEMGEKVMDAAFKGSREVGFTILSMTLSLVAVFIPLMFMGGILGRLFHEFAVTISSAILVSGLVSLTLTPMLCSRFLKPHTKGEKKHGKVYWFVERGFEHLLNGYKAILTWCMRHRLLTVASMVLMVVLTVVWGRMMPMGFLPTDDQGTISIQTEAAEDVSFEAMSRYQVQVAEIVAAHPAVEALQANVGSGGGASALNNGRLTVKLRDRSERPSAFEVVRELRAQLAEIPGIKAYPQVPQLIRIGGMSSKATYQLSLYGPVLNELYGASELMLEKLLTLPQLVDVNSDLLISSPQIKVNILRDRAAALGVTPQQIEEALYGAFGTQQVSTIYTSMTQYYVIMEVAEDLLKDVDALSLIYLRSSNGMLVPLDAVAEFRREVGPLSINHVGQMPSVTLSFNLAEGYSLGEATDAIKAIADRELPGTVSYQFSGSAGAFQDSMVGMGLLLFSAVLVIYVVLGILYEDFFHPLTILSGLPAASFGALFTLWLFGEELNIMGLVGVIMLIGIVKKNAIMMIDFALASKSRGESSENAIFSACMVRFRPIMMTTFAALAAAVPIAMGLGAGAESRRPLGLAVVGGLVVSQVLTLFITPIIYLYMEKFVNWLKRKKGKKEDGVEVGA